MTEATESIREQVNEALAQHKSEHATWWEKNPKLTMAIIVAMLSIVSPGAATIFQQTASSNTTKEVREIMEEIKDADRLEVVEGEVAQVKDAAMRLDEKVKVSTESQQIENEYQTDLIESMAVKSRVEIDSEKKVEVLRARRKASTALSEPIFTPKR